MKKPISKRKLLIIKRRAAVEDMLIRGKTLKQMHAAFERSMHKKGRDVLRIYNEIDNKSWSLAILGRDKKYIEDKWRGGVDLEIQKKLAEKEIDAAKSMAFTQKDPRALLIANKARRDLFGLDAPKRTDITSGGKPLSWRDFIESDDDTNAE